MWDKYLEAYALSFLGKPYIWGGDDPSGFDCSGLVIELLQSVGEFPLKQDTTAQGLYDYFEGLKSSLLAVPRFGSLVFYGESNRKITHVAFALDHTRIIEAGGGGPHVKTYEDAIKYNAFIRIRLYNHRKVAAILRPYYTKIGGLGA